MSDNFMLHAYSLVDTTTLTPVLR